MYLYSKKKKKLHNLIEASVYMFVTQKRAIVRVNEKDC